LATGAGLTWNNTLGQLGFQNAAANGYAYIGSSGAGTNKDLSFYMGATNVMTLDNNGSLAIGSTTVVTNNGGITATTTSSGSVAASLAMRNAGTANGSGSQLVFRGVTNTGAENDYGYLSMVADDTTAKTGSIRFSTGNGSSPAERMRINSSGNVGLGTTAPWRQFTIYGANVGNQYISVTSTQGGSTQCGIQLSPSQTVSDATNNYPQASIYAVDSNYSANIIFANKTPGALANSLTERMRIDNSGNLLVGTTTDVDNTKFISNQSASNYPAVVAFATNGSYTGQVLQVRASNTSTNGTFRAINYYHTSGVDRFYVIDSGAIYSTSTSITGISDERLKENVRDIETGLSSILSLKPRRFDWKTGKGQDKKNAAGFIAQEFQTVFPLSISTHIESDGGDKTEYLTLNHEELIPTMVKAIQEQQTIIQSLTERIIALESKGA
jgi:hypothetical protein